MAAAAVLAVACLRGLFRGLIRETFSVAALAVACLVTKVVARPVGVWLEDTSRGEIGAQIAPWIAGGLLAVLTIAGVVTVGRVVRRGSRWAGLGWADRAAGGVLGAAEGALVVSILLVLASTVLGPQSPRLIESRSYTALTQLQEIAQSDSWPGIDVAAPPPARQSQR